MMPNSIKSDLSFRLTLLIVLVGMATGLLYYGYETGKRRGELLVRYSGKVDDAAGILGIHLWNFDEISAKETCALLAKQSSIAGIKLQDERGRTVYESGELPEQALFHYSKTVEYGGDAVGRLSMNFNNNELEKSRENILFTTIFILSCLVLISMPFVWITIKRHLSNPLLRLQAEIDEIAEGKFDPSRMAGQKTEIQGIIDSFNNMGKRIEKSLHEKELLLGEIHHRVKNNLAIISSLLSMQNNLIDNEKYKVFFIEAENRIKSMALIHEELYKSKDFSKINFNDYISGLAENLFKTYNITPNRIKLITEIEDISLGINTAVPCALIINELLANALKYAFPDGRKGELYIGLALAPDGNYRLTIKDNGIGLPESFDAGGADTFGFRLVVGLAKNQLAGDMEINSTNGAEIIIRFKEKSKGSQGYLKF